MNLIPELSPKYIRKPREIIFLVLEALLSPVIAMSVFRGKEDTFVKCLLVQSRAAGSSAAAGRGSEGANLSLSFTQSSDL